MTFKTAFKNLILEKESYGFSERTIRSYIDIISVFLIWLGEDDFDLSKLTSDIVMEYCRYVNRNKNYSPTTKYDYVRYVKYFIRYFNSKNYITDFSYMIIKPKKAKKRIVNYMSDIQIAELLNTVKSSSEWLTLRNKAYILLMVDSGLRLSDVINLTVNHINFDNHTVVVFGKGEKYRIVPVGDSTLLTIRSYMELRPFKSKYLFVNNKGGQLTAYSIQCFINRLKHKTGFDISAHKLRHNFSEKFLEDNYERTGSSNVNELQSILGHNDINTTLIYQNIFDERLAAKNYQSHYDNYVKNLSLEK